MIKAVFIDIDNTLLDFNKSATLALKRSFEENELKFNDSDFAIFKIVNDELWKQVEKGIITTEKLHEIRFDIVLEKMCISYSGKKLEKCFLANLNDCAVLIDGAIDLVKYLSKKYLLCSASNAPTEQQKKRLAVSGLLPYLSHLFISQEIGYNKPDKRFFEVCFSRIAPIKKEQTIFIGDSLSADIKGAVDYGIKSIYYNFDKIDLTNSFADYSVNDLKEIKNIL